MQVSNMQSPRSGKPVANQFIVSTSKGVYFKSYETMIAFKGWDGTIQVTGSFDYSATTAKYLKVFLGMSVPEVQKAIKDGEIELVDKLTVKGDEKREGPERM